MAVVQDLPPVEFLQMLGQVRGHEEVLAEVKRRSPRRALKLLEVVHLIRELGRRNLDLVYKLSWRVWHFDAPPGETNGAKLVLSDLLLPLCFTHDSEMRRKHHLRLGSMLCYSAASLVRYLGELYKVAPRRPRAT